MKEFTTNSGWLLKSPPTLTEHGIDGFVLIKDNICSYIEKRRNHCWCCYKEFSEEYRSLKDTVMLSIKGSPYKTDTIDDALLHTGMTEEKKNEVMSCYLKEYAAS